MLASPDHEIGGILAPTGPNRPWAAFRARRRPA